jgi:predicted HAD superfamily Cof-like phosphohydrolase
MNVFYDVEMFMKACGHTPDPKRVALYLDLVREEIGELEEAMAAFHSSESLEDNQQARADVLDAICDSIWVLVGLAKTMDLPLDWGWDAVALTNARKVDPELGTVLRDDSGKIMKPMGWKPPDMLKIIQQFDATQKGLGAAEIQE